MERNKFEEHVRTKLQERELEPSPEAWKKLETALGTPKSNNRTLWYAVAASLVAILVVGSFLLKEETQVSNDLVDTTIPAVAVETSEAVASEDKNRVEENEGSPTVETILTGEETLPKKTQEATQLATAQKRTNNSAVTQGKYTPDMAQATVETKGNKVPQKLENDTYEQLKVTEIVAQVENLRQEERPVTTAVIENLLQKAQRDIANRRLLQEATTKIDPASLLNDVESELERSFRDKVFDALGDGFNKIRTAVVERNN